VEAVRSPGGLLASEEAYGPRPSLARGQILYAAITKASAIATVFNPFVHYPVGELLSITAALSASCCEF
jgi:hypothetical protein